jgi:hypothetical protein
MNKQLRNILVIYTLTVTFWVALVLYREYKKSDVAILRQGIQFLNSTLNLNGWSLMHFINYIMLGFFAPDYWKELILVGFIFELVEIPLSKMSQFIDSKIVSDTIVNSAGVLVGWALHHLLNTRGTFNKFITE